MYININKSINREKISMMYELTKLIHGGSERAQYQLDHVRLVSHYFILLSKKLNVSVPYDTVRFISYGHDLLKDKFFDNKLNTIEVTTSAGKTIKIPQNLNWYVRTNLDILEIYKLDDHFNSDCQLHALGSGIFCHKRLHITDPDIIYPILFHSCPIIEVYETLPDKTRILVDIMILADKLSSNKLKKDMGKNILYDLEKAVFGESGKEFNFTLGVYLARIIGSGNNPGKESIKANEYFYEVLKKSNPLLPKKPIVTAKEFKEFVK